MFRRIVYGYKETLSTENQRFCRRKSATSVDGNFEILSTEISKKCLRKSGKSVDGNSEFLSTEIQKFCREFFFEILHRPLRKLRFGIRTPGFSIRFGKNRTSTKLSTEISKFCLRNSRNSVYGNWGFLSTEILEFCRGVFFKRWCWRDGLVKEISHRALLHAFSTPAETSTDRKPGFRSKLIALDYLPMKPRRNFRVEGSSRSNADATPVSGPKEK